MTRRWSLLLAAGAAVLAFVRPPAGPALALVLAFAAARMVDRGPVSAGRVLRVTATVVLGAAAAGLAVAALSGAWRGLEVAVTVGLRLAVLALLAAVLARGVDTESLLAATRRARLDRLALTLGLALNVLPRLAEATRGVGVAWRFRRRMARGGVARLAPLAEVLLAHTARLADEAAAAAALRGHAALIRPPPVAVAQTTRLVVVTGAPGSGKTAAVIAAVDGLVGAGAKVAGFVQPARVSGGEKVGFAVRDLSSGAEVSLARRVDPGEGEHGTRFRFDRAGFVHAAAAVERLEPGGILVADELGPVELRGGGHMPAVRRALESGRARSALVVVRPQLVPALVEGLDAGDVVVVDVGRTGEPVGAIVHALLESRPGR